MDDISKLARPTLHLRRIPVDVFRHNAKVIIEGVLDVSWCVIRSSDSDDENREGII